MTTVEFKPLVGQAKIVQVDEESVEKRVQAEEVCAKRILEVQDTMLGGPSQTARVKFRRLVELFDTWEWLDLQEVLETTEVVLPESQKISNVFVGAGGPCVQLCTE
jgi:hypothetical protein